MLSWISFLELAVELGEVLTILELHRQGLSISAIASRLGMDRKTVRKYINNGVQVPRYGPRAPRPRVMDPFIDYVTERVRAFPELSIERLLREIRALGYKGGRSVLGEIVREVRPPRQNGFEVRFETPAGQQAQVDFAHFNVEFGDAPGQRRSIWLFSIVLGHSRYLRFVEHQDLQTLLRCHMQAFKYLGCVPREILYDRMKTAVLGEQDKHIIYNTKMVACAKHYGFVPRACKAYRAKTKGKVKRPFRYIRQDFFLARQFLDLADLNRQLRDWLDTVANVRMHGTMQRVVAQHFAQERPTLQALPAGVFNGVIRLERRVNHEGLVSVGGNYYSVPDRARRRVLEVHSLAHEIRIYEDGELLAVHPVLDGRKQTSLLAGQRQVQRNKPASRHAQSAATAPVLRRPLSFYDQVAKRLAGAGRSA
ncbi:MULTISPECIES: IS21 family transposase [Burkholderiaceae]|uniref:IS21 family transposase n=1 Tax=Burkholderiaceae TaxID=119060 RepID=UPI000960E936|nr:MULTISPECIES: IS21 family transposase [Burkholderiaceae]MCG1018530.1 IS21 family transposase [Mycetohabitans sp. B4]SIT79499.1 Transposase [Burkholderia sp. b13]